MAPATDSKPEVAINSGQTLRILRTTAFRLTLLFLAVFAGAASAFLAYVYIATAGEVLRRADSSILREITSLEGVYRQGGFHALNKSIIERSTSNPSFLYLLTNSSGLTVSGSIARSPIALDGKVSAWENFTLTDTDTDGGVTRRTARGMEEKLPGGEELFVGADISESEAYVVGVVRALWGAGIFVLILGLAGGWLVSRNVNRIINSLNGVIDSVRSGNISARAPIRGTGDEYDELARGLNDMLDRLEKSISGLKHAGDAIAHDLRSPLTRLHARLETAMIETGTGGENQKKALSQALEDTNSLLNTFSSVLAISRLESIGEAPDQEIFDPAPLAEGIAELYEPICEIGNIAFCVEAVPGLVVKANRQFIAQALANMLDNATKYTPNGGAITFRVRRRSSGDIEFSVTDTGPGIPEADRMRATERFVRLEHSRNQPGTGLGLALVAAIARAHRGHLELNDGPGPSAMGGPGLRIALILPKTC